MIYLKIFFLDEYILINLVSESNQLSENGHVFAVDVPLDKENQVAAVRLMEVYALF